MESDHYIYSEDSSLLGSAMDTLSYGDSFLEIGYGGGGNLKHLVHKFNLVVGTDLNRNGLKSRNEGIDFVIADRASCFRANSFDAIAFNPPYLPSAEIIDRTIDGGVDGIEVPLEFLSSALQVIKPKGKILMLISDLGAKEKFENYCKANHLKFLEFAKRRLFFETLFVYEICKESLSD